MLNQRPKKMKTNLDFDRIEEIYLNNNMSKKKKKKKKALTFFVSFRIF